MTVTGKQQTPDFGTTEANGSGGDLVRETRNVFLPGERRWEEVPIIDDARFTVGAKIEGPAIIDAVDTTVYVPPGVTAERDKYMNYVLTR